jgi:hypothetical protein
MIALSFRLFIFRLLHHLGPFRPKMHPLTDAELRAAMTSTVVRSSIPTPRTRARPRRSRLAPQSPLTSPTPVGAPSPSAAIEPFDSLDALEVANCSPFVDYYSLLNALFLFHALQAVSHATD